MWVTVSVDTEPTGGPWTTSARFRREGDTGCGAQRSECLEMLFPVNPSFVVPRRHVLRDWGATKVTAEAGTFVLSRGGRKRSSCRRAGEWLDVGVLGVHSSTGHRHSNL